MLDYLWPLFMIIGSNICYNVSAKGTPANVNAFFSLTITYLIGTIISFLIFIFLSQNKNIVECFLSLNWASYTLGFAVLGIEIGYIYLYRAGWSVSRGPITANITIALILLLVGKLLFKENITFKLIMGVFLCIIGLTFISSK